MPPRPSFRLIVCILTLWLAADVRADDTEVFTPLFNGHDLAGWIPVNVASNTFTVRDGMIVSTGMPTGVMRTEKQYENFIIELDWKHIKPGGNAGLFVWADPLTAPGVPFARAIEVQILDGHETADYTSQGDLFAIHGAKLTPDRPHPKGWMRCLPSEARTKPAGEWNHYRVECRDGRITLAVNGKIVSGGSQCSHSKGYICLESEGSECHFRNIRICELPDSTVKEHDAAPMADDFHSIYTGLDFTGWMAPPGAVKWKANDWTLQCLDPKGEIGDDLWTEKEYGDFVLIADWRLTAKPQKVERPVILPTGEVKKNADGSEFKIEVDDAGDSGIYVRGDKKNEINIWCWPIGSGELWKYRTDPAAAPELRAAVTPRKFAQKPPGEWNRFIITMKGDRLTVNLNGETVIDQAQLPGVAPRGRIGLQRHGSPVEFANLYVKELK